MLYIRCPFLPHSSHPFLSLAFPRLTRLFLKCIFLTFLLSFYLSFAATALVCLQSSGVVVRPGMQRLYWSIGMVELEYYWSVLQATSVKTTEAARSKSYCRV